MKKIITLATITLLLGSCKKETVTPVTTTEGKPQQSQVIDNLTDATILDRVKIENGIYKFDNKKDLIGLASYLSNIKYKSNNELSNYYKSIGFKSLENKYAMIDELDSLFINANKSNRILLEKHSPEFYNNIHFYKKIKSAVTNNFYIKNIDFKPLEFILNEEGKIMLDNEILSLINGKLVKADDTEYKLFEYDNVLINNNRTAQVLNCYYSGLPADHNGSSGAMVNDYHAYFECHIAYSVYNSDPCAYQYGIIMWSSGSYYHTNFWGTRQGGNLTNSGYFSHNIYNADLPLIISTGNGYSENYPNILDFTRYHFNYTISPGPNYNNGTNLSLITDVVRISNANAKLDFTGGGIGGVQLNNY